MDVIEGIAAQIAAGGVTAVAGEIGRGGVRELVQGQAEEPPYQHEDEGSQPDERADIAGVEGDGYHHDKPCKDQPVDLTGDLRQRRSAPRPAQARALPREKLVVIRIEHWGIPHVFAVRVCSYATGLW